MSDLTPAERARIDAIVGPIVYERSVAPGLAARYDGACESVVRLHDETVSQRQRIATLEDELEGARSSLAAVRCVLATWEHRTHHGDSGPLDLLRDLQAAIRTRPAATDTDGSAT